YREVVWARHRFLAAVTRWSFHDGNQRFHPRPAYSAAPGGARRRVRRRRDEPALRPPRVAEPRFRTDGLSCEHVHEHFAMPEFRSKPGVPSHPDSATIASAVVRELVTLARLPGEQAAHLVLAATESCSDIVGCADAPSDQEPLDLVAILTPKSLTLEIHERGAPFDPSETTAGALAPPLRRPPPGRPPHPAGRTRWCNRGR